MEENLTWFDKNIVPRTKAYKNFVFEIKNTPPENFFQDGERIFTEKEKNFMKIFDHKSSKIKLTSFHAGQEKFTQSHISKEQNAIHFSELKKLISEKITVLHSINPHIENTIEGYNKDELINLPSDALEHLLHLKEEEFKTQQENDDFNRMAFIDREINELKIIINNQNPNIMETPNEYDPAQYPKFQLKYLGFGEGEQLHKDLENGINAPDKEFEIKTTSDKTMPGNEVEFTLKFNKIENGSVFMNFYNAKLTKENGDILSHNFPVNRVNTFTAKEAINLLEGRTVKIEFHNPKTEKIEPAFAKLNFNEPKTEKGNYNFQNFYKNYGVDTAQIVEKSNLVFDKPEWKENVIKSLEKGNIVKVKFELNDKVIEGKAVLNPQYKNLSLYDQDMNRINTNKPLEGLEQDNKHEKNNVKEQSIKR
ncbi:hypothetical protein LPB85_12655 [Chryseobacterium sp. LC2016-27]|uniref:hypothetical protein n=1 Tax=Chryseobacterium sp. LC2016-27 TaxID=2897326 RepID=UPI001E437A03|nr:hypothetical protein [Chryseobacterium sp. LC2016-27]MCD0456288.1 hypothetical protein [Chryseobacterium sp. LC2016-27]